MRIMATMTLVVGVGAAPAALGQPREVKPAINEARKDVSAGERPYEMVWAGRTEKRPPLLSFEDLDGWTVEMVGGAVATFELSREQRVWGSYSGKLTYRGKPGENRILLRPPRPLPIPGKFTAANFWCYGNNWGWRRRADTPQVDLALHLVDAGGGNHRVSLGNVRWEEWWLVHRRVVNHLGTQPKFPFSLAAIEVSGGHQADDRVLFLDSLSFYEEEWPELEFEPRPKQNLKPFPGQDQGLNTGPGTLPFPTREETILPSNFTRSFKTTAVAEAGGRFLFRYDGEDCVVTYRVEPRPSGLGEIRVLVNERPATVALAGAGVRFASSEEGQPKLESVRLEDDVLRAKQRREVGGSIVIVELAYRLLQKSLVVDVFSRGGQATELDLGGFESVERPEALPLPYANYGGQSHCLLARAEGKPFFASVWVDWYRSNGSALFTRREVRKTSARINGGVRYRPKTDGKRNDLFERLFLTISPTFEETLPTIANPPSRWGAVAGEYLWQESWGPSDFKKEHGRSRRLRAYGIEKLIQCNHEIAWRDNADSFTLRIHAAPKKGGDEALEEYVRRQKSLGWRSGLYTNYTDFAPVNENWDENTVQLEPNREWRRAWPRCYALKPSRAVEFDAKYAPMIKKKYDPDSAYTDVHTAVAPWHYCDYDARVPGAGTFAATIYAYGELLINDSRLYGGPIFSEGTYQCIYAGLPDGNYALHYGGYDFARDPILPQFDLYKMHPLSTDIGVGWTTNFCKWPGWNHPENLAGSIDRFIMTTMAYGHIGWLVEEGHGIHLTCRSYYALQQVTKRYALVPPKSVEYFDGEKLLSSSLALADGVYKNSQLRIVYENRLELWLNGSREKSWQLPESAGRHLLPPAGWFAREPGESFYEFSSLRDGRRCDFVRSPEYLFIDGRGELLVFDHAAASGGAAIRAPHRDRLEVIDAGGNGEIGFGGAEAPEGLVAEHVLTRLTAVAKSRPAHADAYDADGRHLGRAEIRHAHGMCWLVPLEGGVRYEIRKAAPEPGQPRLEVRTQTIDVVAGESISLDVTLRGGNLSVRDLRARWRNTLIDLDVRPGAQNTAAVGFRVPETAKPGESLWVRFDAEPRDAERKDQQSAAGWLVLAVRRLADVELAPRTVLLRGGRGTVRVFGRLGLSGKPATVTFEPPEWLSVTPRRLTASGAVDRTLVLEAAKPQAGQLRASIEASGAKQTLVFGLKRGAARPDVARLYDGGVPFSWGYCFRGGREQTDDGAAGASFHPQKEIACGGVTRPGLFSHPPYQGGVGYSFAEFEPIELPVDPCELHVYVGLKDGGHVSDGVDFIVEVLREKGKKVEILRENTAQRAWREVTLDLDAFRGQRVTFRFIADVGPKDNSNADWASWGEPTIRLKSSVPTLTIERQEP